MEPQQLLRELIEKGGAIVCTGDCSESEIILSRACGRMAVFDDGFGIIRRTKEWLKMAEDGAKNEGASRILLASGAYKILAPPPETA